MTPVLIEDILRDQAARKEQVEHNQRVDDLHALYVHLADAVSHAGRDEHAERSGDDRLAHHRIHAAVSKAQLLKCFVILQVHTAGGPQHQPALDILLIRRDGRHQNIPHRIHAYQRKDDAEKKYEYIVEVKSQYLAHAAAIVAVSAQAVV